MNWLRIRMTNKEPLHLQKYYPNNEKIAAMHTPRSSFLVPFFVHKDHSSNQCPVTKQ